jgi:hypothetical protein
VNETLGILLKDHEDIESMRGARVAELVERTRSAGVTPEIASP